MSQGMNLREILKDYNEAVNEGALMKSEFYRNIISEIKSTISRKRARLDNEGNPIYFDLEIELEDLQGNKILNKDNTVRIQKIKAPILELISIDDMISGIYSLGSRGNKLQQVPDNYIRRIARGAKYARILEKSKNYLSSTESLQEEVRIDIERVMKIILPDLTKVSMPMSHKLAQGSKDRPRLSDNKSPTVLGGE